VSRPPAFEVTQTSGGRRRGPAPVELGKPSAAAPAARPPAWGLWLIIVLSGVAVGLLAYLSTPDLGGGAP
jgi:predicted lipid-binding transport protein (Tim44 family)